MPLGTPPSPGSIVCPGVGWYGAATPFRPGRHLTPNGGYPDAERDQAMRRPSLLGQILALNVLLVSASIFLASMAAGLDLTISDQRNQFLVLALAILLTLVVNMWLLRRRFEPLERLLDTMEQIDLSRPGRRVELDPQLAAESADVERLARAFNHMLERLEGERRRSGQLVLEAQEEERRRVARDLHDEVNQALTALLLRLEAATQHAPPELKDELAETKQLANQAMKELLDLARQLRPDGARRPRPRVGARRARARARPAWTRPGAVRAGPRPPGSAAGCRARDLPGRPGGAHERVAPLRREAHRRQPRPGGLARRAARSRTTARGSPSPTRPRDSACRACASVPCSSTARSRSTRGLVGARPFGSRCR